MTTNLVAFLTNIPFYAYPFPDPGQNVGPKSCGSLNDADCLSGVSFSAAALRSQGSAIFRSEIFDLREGVARTILSADEEEDGPEHWDPV
jgi:hypothetical protein